MKVEHIGKMFNDVLYLIAICMLFSESCTYA